MLLLSDSRVLPLCFSVCIGWFGLIVSLHAATLNLPDGGVYEGALENGLFQGEGRIQWPNGASYEGGFKDGLFHGDGRLQSSNDWVYEGEFRAGQKQGQGKQTFADDSVYEGSFNQGEISGAGEWRLADGSYLGEVKQGDFHGQGRYTSAEGDVYEGTFVDGELTGPGRYEGADGEQYQGDFVGWYYHGSGERTDAKGNRYVGQFKDGQFEGQGVYTEPNGYRYEGAFANNLFHGQGVEVDIEGNRYEGAFEYDQFHGNGHLTFAHPVDGVASFEGRWHYGELVEGDEHFVAYAPETIAETVLYNQADLLAEASARLVKGDPEQVEMYSLMIAGDGGEEVFRREVEYVSNLFGREISPPDRQIQLVNSKRTIFDYPLATKTSIDQSLAALAAKMNSDDILFLFLTSHGSRDATATLAVNGLKVADVSATDLKQALDKHGIQWRVLLISACFSGSFIDTLADDHTLIMTAASAKRSSFGCSDMNEFTWFGRAFFKETFDNDGDFERTFKAATEMVAEWESRDGFTPSQPQIHRGDAINKKLKRWRKQF